MSRTLQTTNSKGLQTSETYFLPSSPQARPTILHSPSPLHYTLCPQKVGAARRAAPGLHQVLGGPYQGLGDALEPLANLLRTLSSGCSLLKGGEYMEEGGGRATL